MNILRNSQFRKITGSSLVGNYELFKNSGTWSYRSDFPLKISSRQPRWNLLGVNLSKHTKSNSYLISNNRYSTSDNEHLTFTFDT
jgi:hypothetical protein